MTQKLVGFRSRTIGNQGIQHLANHSLFLTAILAGAICLTACQKNTSDEPQNQPTVQEQPVPPAQKAEELICQASSDRIRVMEYNLENYFDTIHDEGKDDIEFLPKSAPEKRKFCSVGNRQDLFACKKDWTEEVLHAKSLNLAAVIMQVNSGCGPDVLIVTEVENISVLNHFNENYLKKAGYKTVTLLEGWDERGIDVGILSRFPLEGTPTIHQIKFPSDDQPGVGILKTRGILETTVRLPTGENLSVYGLHFPSNGKKNSYRQEAVEFLHSLMISKPANSLQIAGGDFNITAGQEETDRLYSQTLGNDFVVSHLVAENLEFPGSYYYGKDKTWSWFDALILSPRLAGRTGTDYLLDTKSIKLPHRAPGQMLEDEPQHTKRFDVTTKKGASDHLPIYAEILIQKK